MLEKRHTAKSVLANPPVAVCQVSAGISMCVPV